MAAAADTGFKVTTARSSPKSRRRPMATPCVNRPRHPRGVAAVMTVELLYAPTRFRGRSFRVISYIRIGWGQPILRTHTPSIIILYYFPFGRRKKKLRKPYRSVRVVGEYIGKRFVTHNRVLKVGQNDRDSYHII